MPPHAPPDAAPTSATSAGDRGLGGRYREVRRLTEALAAPLSPEDQTVQSMPDVSPTKWHRAHTTWFFETFVLERFEPGRRPVEPMYRELFNSYYQAVGPQFSRPDRGLISRPGVEEITRYREDVDEAMVQLIDRSDELGPDERCELVELVLLGLHHEQQHQELLLMDIKHVLSVNPLEPVYRPASASTTSASDSIEWLPVDGGIVEIGHDGSGFAFDHESPRHRVHLEPFQIADRLVNAGEWIDFIEDGGYRRPELWLSDGFHRLQTDGWDAPLYWRHGATGWHVHTLGGTRDVDPCEPVSHVSHYEADAFARWSGARLPTEAEWEHSVAVVSHDPGRPFDLDALHPRASDPRTGSMVGVFGECWQWTSSAFLPYPGFVPAAGAVGEYNGKFMSGQMVLRGSSAFTPPGHARAAYRNFFPPSSRWPLTGVRLARDVAS